MTAGAAPAATTAAAGLLHALDAVARAYQVARYSGPGNPMGAQVLQRGRLVATKVPFVPGSPLMNRATGLESVADLVDVAAFFAATGQRGWIETTPCTPQAVTDALVAARFRIVHCGATLYAEPLPEPPPATAGATPGIAVAPVDAASRDLFLDTLNGGFGTPDAGLAGLRRNQAFWTDVADWRLFLARCDGEPAGAAVLSLHGRTGYLAAAATLPAFRRRGVQAALIAARIAAARAGGATRITGQAEWGSSSQANMQRAGLQISHLRTLWAGQP